MKQKIAILFGGPSSEHEVSLSSAQNVIANIDTEIYQPISILISKEGVFDIEGKEYQVEDAIKELKNICDAVLPVLHGSFGEDGTLQALLEKENIRFVGSGSSASRVAIDKNQSNQLFEKNGLSIPRSQVISTDKSEVFIDFPIIIKPISEGSSVGLYRCDTAEMFEDIKGQIFSHHSQMLAQEYIQGREFTCCIIEIDGNNVALPASEIVLKDSELFNYDAKYTAGKCSEITPAVIDENTMSAIQDVALVCHQVLGCKSISRTDVIMADSGKIYVLETNTLPGMTKTSFVPAQAEAHGLSIKGLVSILIRSARV